MVVVGLEGDAVSLEELAVSLDVAVEDEVDSTALLVVGLAACVSVGSIAGGVDVGAASVVGSSATWVGAAPPPTAAPVTPDPPRLVLLLSAGATA